MYDVQFGKNEQERFSKTRYYGFGDGALRKAMV